MNDLDKLLTTLELSNSDFTDWGTGPSGYLRLSDVKEAIQKAILDNSCVGKKDHDLIPVFIQSDATPGVDKVVRWCKCCGAIVVDRDYDDRTQPGGFLPMQHPRISSAAHSLTQLVA